MTDEPEVLAAIRAWDRLAGYSHMERMRAALQAAEETREEARNRQLEEGRNRKLEEARQLARELAHEGGDVAEAELEELRKQWPVRSIRPVIPETWTDTDG